MEPTTVVTNKKSNSLVVSVIIILALLLLALLFLKAKPVDDSSLGQEVMYEENMPANSLSSTDEISDIEADLNSNADIDGLDSGLE